MGRFSCSRRNPLSVAADKGEGASSVPAITSFWAGELRLNDVESSICQRTYRFPDE